MKKLLLIVAMAFAACGCSTVNKALDGAAGMRSAVDGLTKKWVLTNVNGTPGKFNLVTGEMWILGADGWVRIGDVEGHTVGGSYFTRRMFMIPPTNEEQ